MRTARYSDFQVGQTARSTKRITDEDLKRFIEITGDVNPLHVDEEFAASTLFGSRIVHGLLTASLFSTMIGMKLPGTGAIYRSQTLEFLRPVHVGDTLTGTLEIRSIDEESERIDIDSRIENQDGHLVIRGEAVVSLLRGA